MSTDRTVHVDEAILLYAFRYALGRKTFAPSDVRAAIRANQPIRDHGIREEIVRDIRRASVIPGGLGDRNIDAQGWLKLLAELERQATA